MAPMDRDSEAEQGRRRAGRSRRHRLSFRPSGRLKFLPEMNPRAPLLLLSVFHSVSLASPSSPPPSAGAQAQPGGKFAAFAF